jgi:hypothetical protein
MQGVLFMSEIVDAMAQSIKLDESKPKRKHQTAQEKAEKERKRFCDVTRNMLEQLTRKTTMLDSLSANEKERQILTGIASRTDFSKHKTSLENLKSSILAVKVMFNCGD